MKKLILATLIISMYQGSFAATTKVDLFFSDLLGLHKLRGSPGCDQVKIERLGSGYAIKSLSSKKAAWIPNDKAGVKDENLRYKVYTGGGSYLTVQIFKSGHRISTLDISFWQKRWFGWDGSDQFICHSSY